jgi:hypothetical protein
MARGGAKAGVQADLAAMVEHPFCARLQIVAMLRLGGNTGESHVLAQFTYEPFLVLFQVINDRLHGRYLAGRGWRNKLVAAEVTRL